ncbi:MAG: hypothetical protein ACKJSK_12825 [Roseibacillus sp.]|jgi:hypothetical protein
MIECPYCRTALTEDTPVCPQCKLELLSAKRVLGPAPRLNHQGVSDFSNCITPREEKRLVCAIDNFQERFPQTRLAVVFKAFSPEIPLGTQLFWLFNTAGLASEGSKQGKNRDILIGINTSKSEAGLTIGYGLEPFLGQDALDHVMQFAVPSMQSGEHAKGVHEIIRGLSLLMEGVCRDLRDMLGLNYDFALGEEARDY